MSFQKGKIVATIGPATESYENMSKLVKNGLSVARLNMSHGDYKATERALTSARKASKDLDTPVAVLVDLQGPKIRLERFKAGKVTLKKGQEFIITSDDVEGDEHICGTTFKPLPKNCNPGDPILLDDGKLRLEVKKVVGSKVYTKVIVGGPISNNKGINLPGVAVAVPALTEKDEKDLRWGLKHNADFIALSFVRSAKDYQDVRKVMDEMKIVRPVIAKIEKPQAIEKMEEVVDAFDAIMVARGDLAVEMNFEAVPVAQKQLVEMCRKKGKSVIVATQMLESMIQAPVPTRAEVSDVANAIYDGTDATMLSAETSVGAYPVNCVKIMHEVGAYQVEHAANRIPKIDLEEHSPYSSVAYSAVGQIDPLNAKAIVIFSRSGHTARLVSAFRPSVPVLAITEDDLTYHTLALSWGVRPIKVDKKEINVTTEKLLQVAEKNVKAILGKNVKGPIIVVSAKDDDVFSSIHHIK